MYFGGSKVDSLLEKHILIAGKKQLADLVIKNAKIINVFTKEIMEADVAICDGVIVGVGDYEGKQIYDAKNKYLVPGLIDGHVHIESSLLSPKEFAKISLIHGVTSVVTDPHEIGNVAGSTGLDFMIDDARSVPMNIFVMLPSCVPVTPFETNGATLDAASFIPFLERPEVLGLAEVMNYQAVATNEATIIDKLRLMKNKNKKIDGHAAGIHGDDLNVYLAAGIRTDHEATTAEEAKERLALGMYLMIREGTVAKDLHALYPAITPENSRRCLFVTDDKLIDDLVSEGSIDHIIRQVVQLGMDPLQAIQMATLNAAECFGLDHLGAIAPGYQADFFLTDDLTTLPIVDVFTQGNLVVEQGEIIQDRFPTQPNPFTDNLPAMNVKPLSNTSFALPIHSEQAHVIEIIPNSLLTNDLIETVSVKGGFFEPSIENDWLKIAVIERHHQTGNIGVGIVKGFQLKDGALATTVAHDSHNIVVVGTNDEDMLYAANQLIKKGGGMIAVKADKELACLPLPIGGLMSQDPFLEVNTQLVSLTKEAYKLGASQAFDPFLTLSFLTLSVIPELKITDKGLFSFSKFNLIEPSIKKG
ncbi:adenine deaminase [Enterococcus durans]|nr:adenine deaminase [Enterococcus durans]MDB1653676.1 adenine deaminase [Enterococcus durans]MDB1656691.1 adenine deaminase [Enterococcus durans]MDB1664455.1 adenine deaminase [Enterococcus durans]MDB1669700.1 adenine deaminase [Enterococcus durans]MDB1672760.1 adenine deaminase [Enterococcus durans]